MPTDLADDTAQYCTFVLGNLCLGVSVLQVQEVIRHDRMTTVPLAPPEVRGLINLRGQIITALDLRRQLGLAAEGDPRAHVVIREGDEAFSVLVDEVGEVVAPQQSDFEPIPVAVPERVRQVVSGSFKLDGKLLLILDTARVLSCGAAVTGARPR